MGEVRNEEHRAAPDPAGAAPFPWGHLSFPEELYYRALQNTIKIK